MMLTKLARNRMLAAFLSIAVVANLLSSCVSPYSPTTNKNLVTSQSYTLNPAAPGADQARNVLAFIDALNSGDREGALSLTCGVMHKQIADKDAAQFSQAQRLLLSERGRGALMEITDQIAAPDQQSVTARVTVRYDKSAPGMKPGNLIIYQALWEKDSAGWRLCNLVGGA